MFSQNSSQYPIDRFIPRRDSQNFEISKYLLNPCRMENIDDGNMFNTSNSRYVNLAYRIYKCKEFEKILWSTLIDKPKKVLNLSGTKNKMRENRKCINEIWPVKPRKKMGIHSPVIILDVPGVSDNLTHNILDWSSKGHLASIHDGSIYFWKSHTISPFIVKNYNQDFEHCIKWNRKGTVFAVSMLKGKISLWNINTSKKEVEKPCCVSSVKCHINCMEWSQDDKYLFTGCSRGFLRIWSSDLLRVTATVQQTDIIKILVSPKDNYVATSHMGGYIQIWNWRQSNCKFQIEVATTARAIAFHPAKESLLAVGDQMGEVTIFNINTHKVIGNNYVENSTCDAMAWNNITGELVVNIAQNVSYFMPHADFPNEIIVYSNMQTITDRINWHCCRVPYLLWGNGGTQLATGGTSEELCIWNFIDLDKKKKYPSVLRESFMKIR